MEENKGVNQVAHRSLGITGCGCVAERWSRLFWYWIGWKKNGWFDWVVFEVRRGRGDIVLSTVHTWQGSKPALAWQFNSEYLTLRHTAGFGCKQQSASGIAAKACVMLGLGCEAHLKTTHKQEALLEVLILEKGRWHWLLVSHCKKTPLGSSDESSSCLLWTASLSWLVSAVWLRVKLWYATPGICAF